MMYISKIDRIEEEQLDKYSLAVVLPDDFINYLHKIDNKLSTCGIDISKVKINYSVDNARLLELGYGDNFWEDKTKYTIPPDECPIDYYGYHIGKEWYPTENYWGEFKPNHLYLCWSSSHDFHFEAVFEYKIYEGIGQALSNWENYLK